MVGRRSHDNGGRKSLPLLCGPKSRSNNWSGNNVPGSNNEIAQFGTSDRMSPRLNSNGGTMRGLRFSSGAAGYNAGDNNGVRLLKIGKGSPGFIENLSAGDQITSIIALQLQSDATINTASTGGLALGSDLTGNNRGLVFDTTGDMAVSRSTRRAVTAAARKPG